MSMHSCEYLEKKHEWGLFNFIVPSTFKAMQSKLSLTMGLLNASEKTDDKHMQFFFKLWSLMSQNNTVLMEG